MKRKIFPFFLITLSFLILKSCNTKQSIKPTLYGSIKNSESSFIVLHQVKDISTKETVLIDTLFINEKGEFTYSKNLPTGIYNLKLNQKKTIQIALDEKETLQIKGTHLDSLNFSGSSNTNLLFEYERVRKESLNRLVYSIRNEIKALQKNKASEETIIPLRSKEIENYKTHLNELTHFIKTKMGTSIAIYPTSLRWNTENIAIYKAIVAQFEKVHPNLDITIKLQDKVNLLKKTAIGSSISTIEMPSLENTIVSLNEVKKKYTLIDFWASWCPPCRAESKLLNELYARYNSKGFEIYGISLDSKKDRWEKALLKDNRIWPNVSSLKGFKTLVAQEYGVAALPTNLIIDANGKIIASNIHGVHLKEFIAHLF